MSTMAKWTDQHQIWYVTYCFMLIYICVKFDQNPFINMEDMKRAQYWEQKYGQVDSYIPTTNDLITRHKFTQTETERKLQEDRQKDR